MMKYPLLSRLALEEKIKSVLLRSLFLLFWFKMLCKKIFSIRNLSGKVSIDRTVFHSDFCCALLTEK